MPKNLDLTIVMPCLNEAKTIGVCVKKATKSLADMGLVGEVLVADNGSTDGSIEIAEAGGARVVQVRNKGYGNALRGGIADARGKWIIMGDADDSYDFSRLEAFVEKLKAGHELVMGCRLRRGGGTILPGAMPWKNRYLGNPALSFLGRLFFKCPVSDFYCGLRGFSWDGYQKMDLRTTGMEFASEMVIKATLRNLKITEVPITLHKDGRARAPHLKPWRDGWRGLRFMLLFSPRWLFLWPGAASLLAGVALFVPLSIAPVQIGRVVLDTSSFLVAGLMIVLGFQVLFFAIFTRLYATLRGLLPENQGLKSIMRFFSLERGVVAGLILALGGLGFLIKAVLKWEQAGFGKLSYPESLRLAIPAVILLMIGAQTIFSSFFLSILDFERD